MKTMIKLAVIFGSIHASMAGSLDSPGPVGPTMHSLDEIHAALNGLASRISSAGAPEASASPASDSDVVAGQRYWSLNAGSMSLRTGTLASVSHSVVTPTSSDTVIAPAYYDSGLTVAGDEHLVAGNIASGVNLFGVAGSMAPPAAYPGGFPYAGINDGSQHRGVAWPNPRFTDNGNGTVTDHLTGLMWSKDSTYSQGDWSSMVTACENATIAGHTDWRLPNVKELFSLFDFSRSSPSLPNGHPFTDTGARSYWSSTTPHNQFWTLSGNGQLSQFAMKVTTRNELTVTWRTDSYFAWPVRTAN